METRYFHANDIVEEIAKVDGYDKIPIRNSKDNFMSKENIPFLKI